MNRERCVHLGLAGLCLLLLSACSQDISDLHDFVQDAKKSQKANVEPLPEIKPAPTFAYAASGLRSPFSPYERTRTETQRRASGNGPRPDGSRRREPLEEFPLDSLSLVGMVEQQGVRWALVKDRQGTIHKVRKGNYLGQNHGKIIQVSELKLNLTEIVPDGLGDWMERPASLALSD